ncbi:disease resistance protein, partial [Trifolium medium]|nr:disease resistance protein [Trifolium medium]
MFDKVISITVSQTPDIRAIQGKIADMLKLTLGEESEEGRAQRLLMSLKEKKRILVIVDSLWGEFNLKDIGISLNESNKGAWKIIVITSDQHVCTLMNCQKEIHLGILSEDESWTWFQKLANVDDDFSNSMNGVPRKLCDECKGLPLTIKTLALSLKGKQNTEWETALAKLKDSEALNDHEDIVDDHEEIVDAHEEIVDDHEEIVDDHEEIVRRPRNILQFCYLCLPTAAKRIIQLCSLYLQEHHIPTEDLVRDALGMCLVGGGMLLLPPSSRSLVQTLINGLFES